MRGAVEVLGLIAEIEVAKGDFDTSAPTLVREDIILGISLAVAQVRHQHAHRTIGIDAEADFSHDDPDPDGPLDDRLRSAARPPRNLLTSAKSFVPLAVMWMTKWMPAQTMTRTARSSQTDGTTLVIASDWPSDVAAKRLAPHVVTGCMDGLQPGPAGKALPRMMLGKKLELLASSR